MAYDVFGVGNSLVDIQAHVSDEVLAKLDYAKGIMTLVDDDTNDIPVTATSGSVTGSVTVSRVELADPLIDFVSPSSGNKGQTRTVTIGGQTVVLDSADADPNGVVIAHIRGALCDADNNVSYAVTASTTTGVFYELVDGPRR